MNHEKNFALMRMTASDIKQNLAGETYLMYILIGVFKFLGQFLLAIKFLMQNIHSSRKHYMNSNIYWGASPFDVKRHTA